MENTNMKLLQALRNSGAEKILEAYDWLQRHRNELKKEVYGPVLLEVFFTERGREMQCNFLLFHKFLVSFLCQVNVSNRVHASYLEEQVPNYIWKVPFFAVVSGILSSCFASDTGHAYNLLDQLSYLDQSVDKATLLVVNANNRGNQAFVPTTYTR